MSSTPSRRSSGKSAAATRKALLAAARQRFLQESYDNVGLRDIAGIAGVDVALIGRYFGNKEKLFREVLNIDDRKEMIPEDLQSSEIPAFMAKMFGEQHSNDGNEHVERLLILLRSASSPIASQIVREALCTDILGPLAKRIGGPKAELRASNSMAVWMGMMILRTIMTVEPAHERADELENIMRRLFQAALAENA